MSGFVSLGIIPEISEYLKKRGIINPMPIQKEVIPAIFKGRNIIGRAQTGTGKTLAYLLPLVQRIKKRKFKYASYYYDTDKRIVQTNL